jgi:hypothetical protein
VTFNGLTKREFLQDYVLSRARATDGLQDAASFVRQALLAWDEIEKACEPAKPSVTSGWATTDSDACP